MKISERLAAFKEENRMTYREMGDYFGVDEKSIRNYISGACNPSDYVLRQIEQRLGRTYDFSVELELLKSTDILDIPGKMILNNLVDESRADAVNLAFAELTGAFGTYMDDIDRYASVLEALDIVIETSTISAHTPEVSEHMRLLADGLEMLKPLPTVVDERSTVIEALRGLLLIVNNAKRLAAVKQAFAYIRKNWDLLEPYAIKCRCLSCISMVLSGGDDSEYVRKKLFAAIYRSYDAAKQEGNINLI